MTDLGSAAFWQRMVTEPERLAAEVCFIDITDLDKTLQRHASLYAWVCAAHEAARIHEERGKWDVTTARARALMTAKTTPDAANKAKTVQVIEAEVELDETVRAATTVLLERQEKRGALRAMTDALEHRKDMLIQISAKQRQEKGNYS